MISTSITIGRLELRPMVEEGLLIYDGAVIRLTRAGMLLAHEVMLVFIGSAVR